MSGSYIPKAVRDGVAEQSKHRCGYCLTAEAIVGTFMEYDHLIPEALGGPTMEDNLWLACSLCNDYKGDRIAGLDPVTNEVAPLYDPRRQVWSDHFQWIVEGSHIAGLTPTGRATVIVLNLNRAVLVIARRAWVAVGWHPPFD